MPRPDIDLMSGQFFGEDPYPAYAWMREHAPVYYDEGNDLWALASYDDVKAASVDTDGVLQRAAASGPSSPPCR